MTSLVLCLMNNGCVEGALQTAYRLASLLDDTLPHHQFSGSQIYSYLDLVVALEADHRTANPRRIHHLVQFFRHLEIHRQCCLVIDLPQDSTPLNGVPSCLGFYEQICRHLVTVDFPTDSTMIRQLTVRCPV